MSIRNNDRVAGETIPVTEESLHAALCERGLTDWAVKYFDVIDSTNLAAKAWARADAPEFALTVADAQTNGRGRKRNDWCSESGKGLWMSLILRPKITAVEAVPLTLAAACAGSLALDEVAGLETRIKWPNDLWAKKRKLCGIMTEISATVSGIEWIVLGVGINTDITLSEFPEEIRETATSVLTETGKSCDRSLLAASFCFHFGNIMNKWPEMGFSSCVDLYRSRMAFLNEPVVLKNVSGVENGILRGVGDGGELLLETEGGAIVPIVSGEFSLRPAGYGKGGSL